LNETDPVSSYRELRGPGVVRCWWEQRVSAPGRLQRVVPDACSDIIVSAGGEAILVGPTLNVSLHSMVAGTHLRGVRFRTEALAAAMRHPGANLRDMTLPLSAVLPDRIARRVAEQVWAGRFPEALRPSPVDTRVRHAVRRLWSTETDVAAVAGELGVTGRHLRRLLMEHTGIGPKAVQRVGRFQRFLLAADAACPPSTLADLAADAGYADQAHLAREVRELAGLAPSALLRERSGSPVEPAGAGPDRLR
jgi:AraC-like DNA-binding protein